MEICYDLNGEVIVGTFHEKELQKTNQKEFRVLDLSNYAKKKKKKKQIQKVQQVLIHQNLLKKLI